MLIPDRQEHVMRGQAFIAATAMLAALGAAQPAAAQYSSYHDAHVATQQQCQQSRNNRTAVGAVAGGVLGALLGREVANRGVRGEGAALGAVVGAVAGGAVGRTTARCAAVDGSAYEPYYGRPYADQGYNQAPYEEPYYDRDGSGLYGGPYRESSYRGGRSDCRPGEVITRDPYGREYREQVMMCRDRDGQWRPQN
jgi:hypothetical protein